MNMDESANRIGFSHKRDETRSAEMAAGVSREQDRADMLTMIVARARARVSGGNKLVPRLPDSTRYSCATAGLCSSAASAVWFLLADAHPVSTSRCSMFSPWLLLRAPLITTIVYGLSCFAAAFGVARATSDTG